MAKCKRRIGNKSLCKYFLVNLKRFLWFREIIKEVCANKFFTFNTGYVHLCLIHISDYAFSIESN